MGADASDSLLVETLALRCKAAIATLLPLMAGLRPSDRADRTAAKEADLEEQLLTYVGPEFAETLISSVTSWDQRDHDGDDAASQASTAQFHSAQLHQSLCASAHRTALYAGCRLHVPGTERAETAALRSVPKCWLYMRH